MASSRALLPPADGGGLAALLAGLGGTAAAAPGLPATEAARFLAQASFGPTAADVQAVQARGCAGWIQDQMSLRATSHAARYALTSSGDPARPDLRQEAWWWAAVNAPDQLRQRVAFALSEIFVVSDLGAVISTQAAGLASYYDLLVNGAFGSFRTLLQQVTLHPVMGTWLSLADSCVADPVKGTHPDENFARELMQLFTVGTVLLHQDGSRVLRQGAPVATYAQRHVSATSRALTGWVRSRRNPFTTPMAVEAKRHDTGAKKIVGDHVIPAGGTAASDLAAVLDVLAAHPNTAPFISTLLIQRLVTSNPSPAYVARVSAIFADDGTGARGNLGAVVAAILLDDEARRGPLTLGPAFGKVREPILRVTHLWRALDAEGVGGRMYFPYPEASLGQAPLRASSVFGFFSPTFAPSAFARRGLSAPELQLADDASLPIVDNFIIRAINRTTIVPTVVNKVLGLVGGQPLPTGGEHDVSVDISKLSAVSKNVAALVDDIDLLFMGGALDAAFRSRVEGYLATVPAGDQRVIEALTVLLTSPQYLVQR